jgi:mannose-1-phosphate guanylyltransferase
MLHAMIMAGGGGTRFWPRSRAKRPKQFLAFSGDRTLLQGTLDRIEAQVPRERTWVITGAVHREEAARQLPELPAQRVVGEPIARDTALCIALGSALIARQDADATMIVMPADHLIEPAREFGRAAHAAEQLAEEFPRALITFGIPPTFPSTNYGYIRRGEPMAQRQSIPAYRVKQFKEKPQPPQAEEYVGSGEYYWNSGIFVWKVKAILAELERQKPKLAAAAGRVAAAWGTSRQDEVFRAEYEAAEKISIDYAVMEGAKEVLLVQAPYEWDDVGSWLALERRNAQDAAGNTVQATHLGIDTSKCVIVSEPGHLIATIGVEGLLIIQDGDATLIAAREREADVKQVVEKLKTTKGLEKYL